MTAMVLMLAACGTGKPVQAPVRSAEVIRPQPLSPAITQAPIAAPAVPRIKVALLLPLSGDNRALGQAMLDAANLALFEQGSTEFELLPRDSGATPDSARVAADEAIAEGAQLILGPVFAAHVPAVKATAARANINVISFSTDAAVAGGNGFVMGQLPGGQVKRVLGYARAQGVTRVALLLSDDAYGSAVQNAANEVSKPLGITLGPVGRLGANQPAAIQAVKSQTVDAVLLAVGGKQAKEIAPQMTASAEPAAKRPRLLGTGLWEDGALGQEPTLVGGWFAAPDAALRQEFEGRYQATYGRKPPRLATLAYDATGMAAALARSGDAGSRAPFDRTLLLVPNGFPGVDGPFRFLANGQVERNYSVLEVTTDTPRVLDPAPSNFDRPAS